MIQRALATLLCLMGATAIGLGIASATAWRADDVLVARAEAGPDTTMVVTEPGVLDLAADSVTVTATADSQVVIALGRAEDVDAWVGGDAHTRVTGLAQWHVLETNVVEAEPAPTPEPAEGAAADPAVDPATDAAADAAADPAATETPAAPADGAADAGAATGEDEAAAGEALVPAPDPSGSDLWVSEVSGDGEATFEWTAQDGRWSVLVASVGEQAGPPSVSLAWPQVVTTPWLWPGVVAGSLLLLGGLAWWALMLLAARHAKRRAARPRPSVSVAEPVGASAGAAVSAAAAGSAGSGPAAPMTRRQLRELEEQQARGTRGSRGALTERFPALVPGGPERGAGTTPERPDPSFASGGPGAEPPMGGRAHRAAATPAGPLGAMPAPAVPSGEPEGRGRRFALRRRWDQVATGGPAPAPVVEQPIAPEPVVPAATQWTPAASADAWRRAWGLPATGDQVGQPGQPVQPGAPTAPGWPGPATPPTPPENGEPPHHRRRDYR